MTREEVVQAALTVERWCKVHRSAVCKCDCPFQFDAGAKWGACKLRQSSVVDWNLEEFLRTRGLKDKHEEYKPYNCKDCVQYPCAKHDENPDYVERCDGFELW